MLDKIIFLTLTAFSLGSLGQLFRESGVNLYLFDVVVLGANLYLLLFFLKKQQFITNSPFISFIFFALFLLTVTLFQGGNLGFWVRPVLYFAFSYFVFNLLYFKYLKFENLKKLLVYNFYWVVFLSAFQYLYFPDISFLESFGYDPHNSRLIGTFLDPNFWGFYLVIYIFLNEFYLKNKYISYLALALTFLTGSRSAFLVLILLVTFLYFVNTKKALLLTFLTLLLFGFSSLPQRFEQTSTANDSSALRYESWNSALQIYQQSPYFGIGIGNYKNYLIGLNLIKPENYNQNSNNYSDSSLLSVLVFSGFLGLILYLIFLASFLKNYRNLVFLIIVLANSLIINSLFFPGTLLLIFITLNLGMLEI